MHAILIHSTEDLIEIKQFLKTIPKVFEISKKIETAGKRRRAGTLLQKDI